MWERESVSVFVWLKNGEGMFWTTFLADMKLKELISKINDQKGTKFVGLNHAKCTKDITENLKCTWAVWYHISFWGCFK